MHLPGHEWLAIDAATSPTVHAQELRFAWERFCDDADDAADDMVRAPIAASWERSRAAGVDPTGHQLAPVVADEGDVESRWEEHPLARLAPLVRECLGSSGAEGDSLLVIADADGVILSIEGNASVRHRAAESMNFAEGVLWSEHGAGTNAIGTAIAADHAVQVFGPEHFNEPVQRWTCAAAPIRDPDTGELLGVIDLTGDYSTVHPHSLAVATATATAVEASLLGAMREADGRLLSRFADRAAPRGVLVTPTGRPLMSTPAEWGECERLAVPPGGGELVLPTGHHLVAEPVSPAHEAYVVNALKSRRMAVVPAPAAAPGGRFSRRKRRGDPGPGELPRPLHKLRLLNLDRALIEIDGGPAQELRRRHAEILALLCANPAGMSADALCAALHGDRGSVGSVRVEVTRVRKLIGPWIDPEHYRLICDVETDMRHVEGLLTAGRVRDAAERYPGPLLPLSEAPGVVRVRDALDAWVRQAVMTSDDVEAQWAWLQTPSGTDDLPAWKRVLGSLPFQDPRRARCAARVGELRRGLAR